MSAPPIVITADTDFKTAMGLMEQHRVRRLPVVDDDGFVAGIVVERDLLVAADRYLNSPVDVARIMTRKVVTIDATTPVVDAAMLMVERKIGGLPVVDASRKLLGIITETDLLNALAAILRRAQPSVAAKPSARSKRAPTRPAAAKPKARAKGVTTLGHAPKAKPKARVESKLKAKAKTGNATAKARRKQAPAARTRSR